MHDETADAELTQQLSLKKKIRDGTLTTDNQYSLHYTGAGQITDLVELFVKLGQSR